MTETEYQDLVNRVLSTLRTNSKEIENLPSVLQLSDTDSFEISKGRKVSFSTLLKHIKGYQSSEGCEDNSSNMDILQIWKELSNDSNLKLVAYDYMPDRVKNAIEWVEIIKSNDNDNAINKWNEIISFLSEVEATSLNEILKTYATKEQLESLAKSVGTINGDYIKSARKISAGTGLTGGGDLSVDRTLSLATIGTAGTYTKVIVDAYGRVTGSSTLLESDIPYLSIAKINNLQSTIDTINKKFAYYLPVSGGAMTSTKLVTNLNADLLDGVHLKDVHKSGWVHVTPYSHDTTVVKYYWFKVAQIDYAQDKAGKAVLELLAMGDNNYPYSNSAQLRIQNYCDIDDDGNLISHTSSIMLITDVHNEVHLKATIDRNGSVWVQADSCGIYSTLSWRAILEGESDYPNVQILNGTTKQFDTPEGTIIHENEGVRYDVLNNTYISYPYNYQIGGSLTIGGANGVTLSWDAENQMLRFSKGGYFLGPVSTKGVSAETGTGGTGINISRMWEELASDDATKLINLSHMPSSVKTAVNWVSSVTSSDADDQINKWNEIVSFLSGISDTSSLSSILSGKANTSVVTALGTRVTTIESNYVAKTRKISAGTGLTGGGDLSADRTLSLATIGKSGTYTKVIVDAYGRVTGNSTLLESDIPALSISKITNLQSTINTINANFANYLPLTGGVMKNTNLVTNLNADLLDGVHLADVYRKSGWYRVVPYINNDGIVYHYWFKVAQINYTTTSGLAELELAAVSDANYMYSASARLTIKGYYGNPSCSVSLTSNAYLSTRINVALDKDGGVWVKSNCSWSSYLRWRAIVNDEGYTGITILDGSTKQLDQPINSCVIEENTGATYRQSKDAFETAWAAFDVGIGSFKSYSAQIKIQPYNDSAYIEFGNADFTNNVPAFITGYSSNPLNLLTISSHSTIFTGSVTIGGANGVTLSFDATNDMLKFSKGGYFLGAVSTKGVSAETGTGGAGVNLSSVWDSLSNNTDVYGSTKIHIDHIPTLTKSKISDFPTLVSAFANDAGYITASAIINKADKATTLAGYGITDAVTLNTEQTITRVKTFTNGIKTPIIVNQTSDNALFIGATDNYYCDLNTQLSPGYSAIIPLFQKIGSATSTTGDFGSARKGVIRLSGNASESQLLFDHYNATIHYRGSTSNGAFTEWKRIAFTDDVVTLNTNQTISGVKTLSANLLSATRGTLDIGDEYNSFNRIFAWHYKPNSLTKPILSSGKWYRIWNFSRGVAGTFQKNAIISINKAYNYEQGQTITLAVSINNWGQTYVINQLSGTTGLITKVRVTGKWNYSYVDVYISSAENAESYSVSGYGNGERVDFEELADDATNDSTRTEELTVVNGTAVNYPLSLQNATPLVVNSTTMVANLNANYLGGFASDRILTTHNGASHNLAESFTEKSGGSYVMRIGGGNAPTTNSKYGNILHVEGLWSDTSWELLAGWYNNELLFRSGNTSADGNGIISKGWKSIPLLTDDTFSPSSGTFNVNSYISVSNSLFCANGEISLGTDGLNISPTYAYMNIGNYLTVNGGATEIHGDYFRIGAVSTIFTNSVNINGNVNLSSMMMTNNDTGVLTLGGNYIDVYAPMNVKTSLTIGQATISWDSVNGMLKVNTGAYFTGPVSTKGVSGGSGLVAVAQFGITWHDAWAIDANSTYVESFGTTNKSISEGQGTTNGSTIEIVSDAFAGKKIGDIEIFTLGWENEAPANVRLAPYKISGNTLYCALLLSGTMSQATFKIKIY